MDRLILHRQCSLIYRAVFLLCSIALVSFASPVAAQTMVRPLAWRETPVIFNSDSVSLCFVPDRPDLVLTYEGWDLIAYNINTGERTTANQSMVVSNNVNGYGVVCQSIGEYTNDSVRKPEIRPTHVSANDHRYLYRFEYDPSHDFTSFRIWVSADGAQTWEERFPPANTYMQALAVSPTDSATLYITTISLVDTGQRAPSGELPLYDARYDVFRSSDTGRSWQLHAHVLNWRSTVHYLPDTNLSILWGSMHDDLVLSYDQGLPGSSNRWTYLLSVDGGRTFREVGYGGMGGGTYLMAVGNAVWRLQTGVSGAERLTRSVDGGMTWQPVAGPPTYPIRDASLQYGSLKMTPADPSRVILLDGGRWYSADGGDTWQQIADPSRYDVIVSPFAPFTVLRIKDRRLAILDLDGSRADPLAPFAPPPASDYETLYFPETGHQISQLFREGWQHYGGVTQLGYPISEEFVEIAPDAPRPYLVQYFERARLEYHPEFDLRALPDQTLLGLVGNEVTAPRRAAREPPFLPVTKPCNTAISYFPETRHTLRGQFKSYWESTGGLMRHGYPISEEFIEVNRDDGQAYLVQYFERSRMEWHPEVDGGRVLLGRLGAEVMFARYGR